MKKIILFLLLATPLLACSDLIVTPGASADGSSYITYTCDGVFHPILRRTPAADHADGEVIEITTWGGEHIGEIPQVPHTYAVNLLINEHQLALGESTFGGREELYDPDGTMRYWDLMQMALQRSKTAVEALEVMIDLADTHGYRSTGESISIADANEVWLLEILGAGPGSGKVVWVAARIPDGMISAHTNMSRIGEFPTDDPENWKYSANIFSLAEEKGWWKPEDGPFNFQQVYDPADTEKLRYCATRTWSIFRRAAPAVELDETYHRGNPDAEPFPLWVKPEHKLTTQDVFNLMRDHYEGTPYDMTKGLTAGPFGMPERYRPIPWESSAGVCGWERPISSQQTGFSIVAQMRNWLPAEIGGVLWYGVDNTYTTCWFPLYAGAKDLPESFARGSLDEFSWDSAWWIFNLVANYADLKYSKMIVDIQAVQSELETGFINEVQEVDQKALASDNPSEVLTEYSVKCGELVMKRWSELAIHLLTKYNDGYERIDHESQEVGYQEHWRERVGQSESARLLGNVKEDTTEVILPY